MPRDWLDWQPSLIASQPWRTLTAAFVHWTPLHLAANLAGCAVLGLLGSQAAVGRREALAGLIALPLTQLGLLLRPDRERLIGAAIALGLVVKLASEDPLGPVLRATAGFDFAVAPFAHLSGAVAGVIAWALTMAVIQQSRSPRPPHGT
jgi:membrane associated rhomboid family serine protease